MKSSAQKSIKILISFLFIFNCFFPLGVNAVGLGDVTSIPGVPVCTAASCVFTPMANIPIFYGGGSGAMELRNEGLVGEYLNKIFTFGIVLASGLAVVMIAIGGVKYSTTDAFSGKSEGKAMVTNAIVGLILALTSYLILSTINPALVGTTVSIKGGDNSRSASGANAINSAGGVAGGAQKNAIDEAIAAGLYSSNQISSGGISAYGGNPNIGGVDSRGVIRLENGQYVRPDGSVIQVDNEGFILVQGTVWGYKDSLDSGANTAPILDPNNNPGGINTNNTTVTGVALPMKYLMQEFGLPIEKSSFKRPLWEPVRNGRVVLRKGSDASAPTIAVPVIDFCGACDAGWKFGKKYPNYPYLFLDEAGGPPKKIDMTYATCKALGFANCSSSSGGGLVRMKVVK